MIYLIVGRRKRGKTTLGLYMTRKDSIRRAIFDSRNMIPVCPNQIRVRSTRDLIEQAMPALADGELEEVIYSPADHELRRPFVVFSQELNRWTDEHPTTPINILIDELGFIEEGHRDPAALRRALRNCEPDIVNVFITCHRPIDIPVNTRSIADYWALFHCVQEHDIDVIQKRCGSRIATQVQQLTARSFVLFDDAEPEKSREYPDRPDATGKNPWYVPLRSAVDRVPSEHVLSSLEKKRVDAGNLFD
jgi:hypothetical protein